MLKVGNTYEATIKDLDYKGDGIALLNDSYIYIAGALPLEIVEFRLIRFKNNIGFGRLTKVIKKSKNRVADFNQLGSLNLSHADFQTQLSWQSKVTKETFEKVFKREFMINDIVTDNVEFNYRNKVTFHVMKNNTIKLGLYKANSKELIEVDEFVLANKYANELVANINKSEIKVDHNKLKHIMIKNNSSNELLVTLVGFNRSFYGKDELIELISTHPNVKGLTLNIKENEETILGSKSYLLFGVNELTEGILLMTDQSFLQTNYPVMKLTYDIIAKYITGKRIIDAYSGIGSIVYSILDNTTKAVLIESNAANIKLADKIKKTNKISNVEIVFDLAENAIDKYKGTTLIVDPPRVGLKETFINEINRMKPKRMIYLSCNLQTLIRDLRLLEENYTFSEIYPIKMFPQTNSFETLVILNIK